MKSSTTWNGNAIAQSPRKMSEFRDVSNTSDIRFVVVYRTIIDVILHLFIICNDLWCQLPFLSLSPSGWRGIVVTVRAGGRAGGCQTCGTHISVTAWRIFSIRSSMELSRPVVVHCHGNLPICPIWACPWAKNLSNLPQIGSRLCGTHISETAGWIDPI